jgi:hypothetical protein
MGRQSESFICTNSIVQNKVLILLHNENSNWYLSSLPIPLLLQPTYGHLKLGIPDCPICPPPQLVLPTTCCCCILIPCPPGPVPHLPTPPYCIPGNPLPTIAEPITGGLGALMIPPDLGGLISFLSCCFTSPCLILSFGAAAGGRGAAGGGSWDFFRGLGDGLVKSESKRGVVGYEWDGAEDLRREEDVEDARVRGGMSDILDVEEAGEDGDR